MNEKNLLLSLKSFLKDESGQASVEYVLFLGVIMAAILTMGKYFLDRFKAFVDRILTAYFKNKFFQPERMYRFNLGVRR